MRVLAAGRWEDGFLDYHRRPPEYRIQILAFKNLERLDQVYFVRPKSLRLLWNYIFEVGPVALARKVWSRLHEDIRNEKYLSIGIGTVLEAPATGEFCRGQTVALLAPCQPACIERVVLPGELLIAMEPRELQALKPGEIAYWPLGRKAAIDPWWAALRGWSSYSGVPVIGSVMADVLSYAKRDILQIDWSLVQWLPTQDPKPPQEWRQGIKRHGNAARPIASLFGYGNYARTMTLPHLRRHLSIEYIHEIDVTQIPKASAIPATWDSSPEPRPQERSDVFLIAGYHHTHAPLAARALRRNASAVVEKPLAVDEVQLQQLLAAMESSTGRLFCCYQKRYLPFNRLALEDLRHRRGDPISYHCIVYEVPLPALHWYQWPNSKSRLISSGCHWIDHFLFLNDFCHVRSFDLTASPDGTVNCSVTLRNGAFFTMVLTDRGSSRIGVQEYIELRSDSRTIKIINASEYCSEDRDRILRSKRINKMASYAEMYRQIARRLRRGDPGDSPESVRISCGLILALEAKLQNHTARAVEQTGLPAVAAQGQPE